jgi:hypothetical protein
MEDVMRYVQITEEDRELLHYNPNTDDLVEWTQEYARKTTELNTADLMSDVMFFARMLDGAFDLDRMADEGNDEQKAAVAMVRKYLQPNSSV